jgi:hypothetical protein
MAGSWVTVLGQLIPLALVVEMLSLTIIAADPPAWRSSSALTRHQVTR